MALWMDNRNCVTPLWNSNFAVTWFS